MKRRVFGLTVACLMLALAACSSAPIHFYTLVPPPSTANRAPPATYAIAVLPVTVPAQVDRPQMVIREGDSTVALLDGQRWIAPLADEIRAALSADLTRQLGAHDVYGMGQGAAAPVYRINVDIQRFESVPGQYTLLAATWDVNAINDKSDATPCSIRIKEPVGQGYAAIAKGHQRGLESLAGMIAGEVRDVAQGHAIHCRAAAQ